MNFNKFSGKIYVFCAFITFKMCELFLMLVLEFKFR